MRTNDPSIVDALQSRLPFGARLSKARKTDVLLSFRVGPRGRPGLRPFHLLYLDGALSARSLILSEALDAFESLLQLTVAERSKRDLFVHAGVVEWNGKAILLPGRTLSGKSSLTVAFLNAGARYYSDEYAVIDRNGRVRPFSTPISIRQPDGARRTLDMKTIRASAGTRAIPVGWIIVTSFRSGSRWHPRKMTSGEALLAMFANTVPARRRPKDAFAVFRDVVRGAVAWEGVRGESEELVRQFLAKCARSAGK